MSCPFAKQQSNAKTCPVSGKQQSELNFEILDEIKSTLNTKDLNSKAKCPFADQKLKDSVQKCPEFQKESGCPFKDSTLEDIASKLDQVPESHPKCPAFKEHKKNFKEKIQEENLKVLEVLLNRRWDLFFDEPIKYVELSKKLRKETTPNHIKAESVPFIKRFVKFDVDILIYRRYLSQLYFVYDAIETEMEVHKENSMLKKVHFPKELNRVESLSKDLEYFYGKDFRKLIKPMETTKVYVNRIREVSSKNPELLIAQCYTRYLGDLYGGQILKKKAKKAMNLGTQGTEFYEFKNIENVKEFRDFYQDALNYLNITYKKAQEIVDEANNSFVLNMNMFSQLDDKNEFDENLPLIPSEKKSNSSYYVIGMIFLLISILLVLKNFQTKIE